MIRLRTHRLRHLRDLAVSSALMRARFLPVCAISNCRARCCQDGVFVDSAERDGILRHAALIQRHMDTAQESDPGRWFKEEAVPDMDFPAGVCFATRVRNGACVFLSGSGRCTVQLADEHEAGGTLGLKPFFCTVFPLTLIDGVLVLDDLAGQGPTACCRPDPTGALSVFEVCRAELVHVLGEAGFEELRASIEQPSDQPD